MAASTRPSARHENTAREIKRLREVVVCFSRACVLELRRKAANAVDGCPCLRDGFVLLSPSDRRRTGCNQNAI